MCLLGSLSQYSTVSEYSCVKVDDDIPLEKAALVGCGVPTGWCSAVYAADVEPGETVMIYGIGGVGANAVQGAAHAGAANVIAVDPLANKRETAEDLGATHSADYGTGARDRPGAHAASAPTRRSSPSTSSPSRSSPRPSRRSARRGTVVITGLADPNKLTVQLSSGVMTLYQKQLKGTLFGSGNPMADIPKLIGLYQAGKLKLDELITKTYTLDEVNQGFQDMLDGKNIRGVVRPRALDPARCFLARVDERIVGLRREAEVLAASLSTGIHVVLEGPPGTGKSTLLRAVADGAHLAWSSSRATPS